MDPDISKHFDVVNVDLLMDKVERNRLVSSKYAEFSRAFTACVSLDGGCVVRAHAKINNAISKCQAERNYVHEACRHCYMLILENDI